MITGLQLQNFKSFDDQIVQLAPFTVLVGANASGKSNFFDAIRFLQGLALGYSIADVLAGRYEGGVPVWRGIRGGASEIALRAADPVAIKTQWVIDDLRLTHRIEFTSADDPRVVAESLLDPHNIYLFDTHAPSLGGQAGPTAGGAINVAFKRAPGGSGGRSPSAVFAADKSILTRRLPIRNVHDKVVEAAEALAQALSNILFLDLQPTVMRDFRPIRVKTLGANGENISPALFELCQDEEKKIAVVDWISELCAPEVVDIGFVTTQFDQVMFYLIETTGRRVSAQSVSDGTLRFLGQLVALLTATTGSVLLIEELENGLHPSRQGLLAEAIENHVSRANIQVVASTHSPTLLESLGSDILDKAVVFARNPENTGTVMRNLSDIPNFRDIRTKRSVSDLFTTLWLERAL